jgi:hypothetical protein
VPVDLASSIPLRRLSIVLPCEKPSWIPRPPPLWGSFHQALLGPGGDCLYACRTCAKMIMSATSIAVLRIAWWRLVIHQGFWIQSLQVSSYASAGVGKPIHSGKKSLLDQPINKATVHSWRHLVPLPLIAGWHQTATSTLSAASIRTHYCPLEVTLVDNRFCPTFFTGPTPDPPTSRRTSSATDPIMHQFRFLHQVCITICDQNMLLSIYITCN